MMAKEQKRSVQWAEQMRETNYLQIVKSGLHRTAGPANRVRRTAKEKTALRRSFLRNSGWAWRPQAAASSPYGFLRNMASRLHGPPPANPR